MIKTHLISISESNKIDLDIAINNFIKVSQIKSVIDIKVWGYSAKEYGYIDNALIIYEEVEKDD